MTFFKDDENVVGVEGGEWAVLELGYAHVGAGGGERVLTTVEIVMRLWKCLYEL